MVLWALLFLTVAVIASILGFTGVAIAISFFAKILFFIALIFFLIFLMLIIAQRMKARAESNPPKDL